MYISLKLRFTFAIIASVIAFGALLTTLPAHAEVLSMTPGGASAKNMPPTLPDLSTSTPSIACPTLTKGLARGMRDASVGEGGDVSSLQQFLVSFYHKNPDGLVTGYFGPLTEASVMQFQKEHGVPAIGLVGPLTRKAIAEACAGGGVSDPTKPRINFISPKGDQSYTVGDMITVSWTSAHVPKDAGMYLQLVSTDGDILISDKVPYASGTAYMNTSEFCNGNFSDAIFSGCENLKEVLKDGKKEFKIHATLFTPKDTCFGFCLPSTVPVVTLGQSASNAFTIEDPDAGAFTATSTTGKAPLTTTFLIRRGGEFNLNYGDGSSEKIQSPFVKIMCIRAPCIPPPHEVPHIYKKPGTYWATLTETVENNCKPTKDTVCALWVSREETVGTIAIEVTDPKKK